MKKIAPFLTLAVIALGIWGVGLFYLERQATGVHALARDLYSRQESQLNLSSLRISVGETAEARDQLNSHFVRQDNVVAFIETVEDLGRASGLAMPLQISSPAILDSSLALEIRAQGSFPSIYKFLNLLETLPNKLSISRADLKYNGNGWDAIISLQLLSFLAS